MYPHFPSSRPVHGTQEDASPWVPTLRTHLLHVGVALFLFGLAFFSTQLPHEPVAVGVTALACLALPLASVATAAGGAVSLAATWVALVVPQSTGVVASRVTWGVVTLMLARCLPRQVAYSFASVILLLSLYYDGQQIGLGGALMWPMLVGLPCLVLGEILRHQREQVRDTSRRRHRALVQQRRMVASELHDTVARDLTYAVMKAEQAKLAHPHDVLLVDELDAVLEPMRAATAQLRRSLQTMSALDDVADMFPISSPPRPVDEAIADARCVLARRHASLEVEGTGLLAEDALTPGTQQQVLRVVDELVDNAAKYTSASGSARLIVEVVDDALECMITNTLDGAEGSAGTRQQDLVLSSGLGLEGVRRRVEALDGTIVTKPSADRWTVAFRVPLRSTTAA